MRGAVAGLAQVVVAGGDEAHLVAAFQVNLAEPLESAVLGHDLHQRFQRRIALAVVAGLVGVGDHHHVLRIVVGAQPLVEGGEGAEPGSADALAPGGGAEQHVVVAALEVLDGPLVAEEGDEALVRKPLHVARQHGPFVVVHPDVVFGVGYVVQLRIVLGPAHEALRGADALGEAGVAVGVAPVDAALRRVFHQHRVGGADDAAVCAANGEAVHAGRVETDAGELHQRGAARGDANKWLAVGDHFPARHGAGGAVVVAVLDAQPQGEGFAGRHDGGREAMHAGHGAASDRDRCDGHAHQIAAAVEIHVYRQRQAIGGEGGQAEAPTAAGGVAVGDGDFVASGEVAGDHAELQRRRCAAEAAVHAGDGRLRLGEPHGGIGGSHGDVVVPGWVLGLVGEAAHEVPGYHHAAAGLDVLAAHGVRLADGGVAGDDEGAGARGEGAHGVRLFVQQRQLADRGIQAGDAAGIGGVGEYARHHLRGVHGHIAAAQGVGIHPGAQRLRSGAGVGGAAGRSPHLGLQRLHGGAQVGVQIVRRGGFVLRRGAQRGQQRQAAAGGAGDVHRLASATSSPSRSMRGAWVARVSRQKSGLARSTSRCLAASCSAVMRPVSRKSAW